MYGEPTYSIEQIAAKTGKQPAFVATRLKLIDLVPSAVDAFYRDEIGVGHALLLAKLPAEQQEEALTACFREDWSASADRKAKRILLPVKSLQFWIEQNVLLFLKEAPFDKRNAHLVAIAGSCVDCPKRTGHNKLLFSDLGKQDACTDPACYQAKVTAHVAKQLEAKPQLVQISTAYGKQSDGSTVLPRNQYTTIRDEKPKSKEEAKRPEFKVCKFTKEAIITDGSEVGTVHKVCANPACPVHHPKAQPNRADEKWKAEQDKRRKEEAVAAATGVRVLAAIGAAVPVRLLKRDLVFVLTQTMPLLDEWRLQMLARQHGIRKSNEADSLDKLVLAFVRRAEEGTFPFTLGGEVDKAGHPLFRGMGYERAKPDLLVHHPGDMDSNLACVEVKRAIADADDLFHDILKLSWFCAKARYHRGVLLIYGDSDPEKLTIELQGAVDMAATRSVSMTQIQCVIHRGMGQAAVFTWQPPLS